MRGAGRFGRFELQVGAILVLLVLFLGVLDLMNIFLLLRSRDAVESAERSATVLAAGDLVRSVGRDSLLEENVSDATLRRESARLGVTRVRFRDPTGKELASVPASSGRDPDDPQDSLSSADLSALRTGRPVTLRLDEASALDEIVLVAIVPLLDSDARLAGTVEVHRPALELASVDGRVRTVLWVQVIGLVIVAALALAFARWVSKPYRRLAAAANQAGLTPAGEESGPEQLEGAFRTVMDKLREQEETLGSVGTEGGGLGDLVRFANRSAAGMTTGVLVLDRKAEVAALNGAAALLLGVDPASVKGRALDQALPDAPELAALVDDCVERGQGASREVLTARLPDGRTRHLGLTLSPSVTPAGKVAGVLVLMTDLTEIRDLQEHARLRENLASVGRLSAGIAHEFRNALGTILGYARMLEKREDTKVRGPAREIVREVDAVRKTVDEFLLFAKPPEPAPTRVDLDRMVQLCAAAAPERIDVEVAGEFGTVEADEGLLRRVFENLLQNAADAAEGTERGVSVRITGRPVAGGRTLQVEVEDNGPGIPPDRIERVFEPFYTSRARGTGLGLALVQRTIVDLGGTVEVSAGAEGGALFRLRLPRV